MAVCSWILVFIGIVVCAAENSPLPPVESSQSTTADNGEDVGDASAQQLLLDLTDGTTFGAGFAASLAVIIASEIGDKTFFIAAIMAMRHPRQIVFLGAIGALALMTVLSAALGYAVPQLLPKEYTHYAAMCLFFFFGFKLLYEAYQMEADEENEELVEVAAELKELDEKNEKEHRDIEAGQDVFVAKRLVSPVFWQAFSLTFLAEWGDRSQIATIALAAAKNPVGVTIGGTLGHAICTGIAVIGGKMLAARISVRHVNVIGGLLFLVFGFLSLVQGPESAI